MPTGTENGGRAAAGVPAIDGVELSGFDVPAARRQFPLLAESWTDGRSCGSTNGATTQKPELDHLVFAATGPLGPCWVS